MAETERERLFQYLKHCEEQAREKAADAAKTKRRRQPTEFERELFHHLEHTTRRMPMWPTKKELAQYKTDVEEREKANNLQQSWRFE